MLHRKFLFATVFLVSFSLGSCVHNYQANQIDKPGVTPRTPQSEVDLLNFSRQLLTQLSDARYFNSNSCSGFLNSWMDSVYDLPSQAFFSKTDSQKTNLNNSGDEIITNFFQTRLKIQEKLRSFQQSGAISKECLSSIRRSLVYLRYGEEMIIDILNAGGKYSYKEKLFPFEGGFPVTVINPEFGKLEIKNGDIFVVRGSSEISATISRMGDEETFISHLAIAVWDPENPSQLYALESLIATGTRVVKWEEWIDEQKKDDARIALYRTEDQEWANASATELFNFLKGRKDPVLYDFKMNDTNGDVLYCAEVVSYAYRLGAKKLNRDIPPIPQFKSTTVKFLGTDLLENFGFLDEKGQALEKIFSPNDIEVDTRFKMVADFRNFPLLRQVRMQDSILSSMNDWVISKKYRYKSGPKISVLSAVMSALRKTGLHFSDTIPAHIPKSFLKMFIQIRSTARILQKNLYEKEKIHFEKTGHSLTHKEMMEINEEFRRQDCLKVSQEHKKGYVNASASSVWSYIDPEKKSFHLFFNNGMKCD